MVERYRGFISKSSKLLNYVGEICIVFNMLLIVSNILLRILLNKPLAGLVDYVGLLTTLIIGPSLAYCAVQGGHIRVEFIIEMFPKTVQKVVGILENAISFVFLIVVTWYLGRHAYSAFLNKELPMTAKIPIYPFIYMVAVSVGLYALVTLGNLMLAICSRKEV